MNENPLAIATFTLGEHHWPAVYVFHAREAVWLCQFKGGQRRAIAYLVKYHGAPQRLPAAKPQRTKVA